MSSSGTSAEVCAGDDAEIIGVAEVQETGVADEQATRKEAASNALTLRKMGSFIFPRVCRFCVLAS